MSTQELMALRDASQESAEQQTRVDAHARDLDKAIHHALDLSSNVTAAAMAKAGDFLGAAAVVVAGDDGKRKPDALRYLLADALSRGDALRAQQMTRALHDGAPSPVLRADHPATTDLAGLTVPAAKPAEKLTADALLQLGRSRIPPAVTEAVDALRAHHARMAAGKQPPPKSAEGVAKQLYMRAREEMDAFRTSLFAHPKMTQAEATTLASAPSLHALFRHHPRHISRAAVREALAEVCLLLGPKPLGALTTIIPDVRSHVRPESGVMGLADIPDVRDLVFHESAHFFEYLSPEVAGALREWRDRRATGHAEPLRSLVVPEERAQYGADERALPDAFVHPYVGVVYDDPRGTEVFSVGFERFSAPGWMVSFLERDPEHFALIVGALAS